MKEKKKEIEIKNANKRHEKDLRRLKLKNGYTPLKELSNFQFKSLSKKSFSAFDRFMNEKEIPTSAMLIDGKLKVPEKFSFVIDFDKTMLFFDKLNYLFYNSKERIEVNFEYCDHISISAASFLQIVIMQYERLQGKYNSTGYSKLYREIRTKRSKNIEVNKMLCALEIIDGMNNDENVNDITYLPLGLKVFLKERKSYKENKKGRTCDDIIGFVNSSIQGLGFELNLRAKKSLSNLFSEILGNAEDHTKLNEYYVNGVSFKEDKSKDDALVELNLTIINLGYSIYEGFQKTKQDNFLVIDKMKKFHDLHEKELKLLRVRSPDKNYSKESLFTLYALQEGISRIKYVDNSRGNGTMNFINAFMKLGEFGEDNSAFESKLNVISGHTVIECTNKYKPYSDGTNFVLSLNQEKDIRKLPDRKCIFISKNYFPGTILQVKIYMNKKYFIKIINKKDEK